MLIRHHPDQVRRGEGLPRKSIIGREEEILKLFAEVRSSRDIAELLVISVKTVDRHRANLLQKLGMCDRGELTCYAIRTGLIEPWRWRRAPPPRRPRRPNRSLSDGSA